MKRKGFTLLELVVATVIFSIVIAAAYSLLDSARSLTTRAELRAQLFQSARVALQAIEDDFRGAVLPAVPPSSSSPTDLAFIATNGGSDKEPLDKIDFISISRHTAGQYDVNLTEVVRGSDVAKLSYWIEQDTTKKAHGLVRERPVEMNPVSGWVHRDEDVTEISRDVAFLNLKYYDSSQWLDSWDSTQLRKLPMAIEVTVYIRGEWHGEDVLEPFTTRFYLPIGAETPEQKPQ